MVVSDPELTVIRRLSYTNIPKDVEPSLVMPSLLLRPIFIPGISCQPTPSIMDAWQHSNVMLPFNTFLVHPTLIGLRWAYAIVLRLSSVVCCLSSVHNSQDLPQFLSDFNSVWFVWKSSGLCIKFQEFYLLINLWPNLDLIRALCPQFTRNASPPSILSRFQFCLICLKKLGPVH